MSVVFKEFCDENMHRNYPLVDDASVTDTTGSFKLFTNLMVDMFLCVPNTAGVDLSKFYVSNITVRRFFVDITVGHDDVGPVIGSFRNIDVSAALHTSYDFVPATVDIGGSLNPLYYSTGQVTIGSAQETAQNPGSWSFDYAETPISPTRIAQGLMNVQHIEADDRLMTGVVTLKEGANVTFDVVSTGTAPDADTTITVNASLSGDVGSVDLLNDTDVLNALIGRYGHPIVTINGLRPDATMNFGIIGEDCTQVDPLDHGVAISNPCARPCGTEDSVIAQALNDIGNLDLRYGTLKTFIENAASDLNRINQRLIALGNAEQ